MRFCIFVCLSIHNPLENTLSHYEIRLPQFEGPFDLLLFFIERDELDIHNIPISKITNDFLDYIHLAETMNIELASEFILVAATLMRIKARMLLPRYPKDEEGNELDPRHDLIRQLLEYKQYKEAAGELRQKEEERAMKVERGNVQSELSDIALNADGSTWSSELNSLSLFRLMTTFEKVMERFRVNEERIKHTIIQFPFTLDEERANIEQVVRNCASVTFTDLFSNCQSRLHACFVFLALLDLIQSRQVHIFISEGYNNFYITGVNPGIADAN